MFHKAMISLTMLTIASIYALFSLLLGDTQADAMQSSPSPTLYSLPSNKVTFAARVDGRRNIYLIQADGSNLSKITDTVDATNPSWSPDGKSLAFSSLGEQGWSINVLNQNNPSPILLADGNSDFPAWSPQNDLIAFVSWKSGRPRLYTMNTNGSNQRQLSDIDVRQQPPVWSPDGKYLAFVSTSGGLYFIDMNSLLPQKIADSGGSPSWSPNSTRIAFAGYCEGGVWCVFSVDVNGSDLHNLTPNLTYDARYPNWSPNGEFIAFVSSDNQGNGIFVIGSDGSQLSHLPFASELWSEPVWSPDSKYISFVADCGAYNGIYVVDSSGSDGRCITSLNVDSTTPVWMPHS